MSSEMQMPLWARIILKKVEERRDYEGKGAVFG